MYSLLSQVVDRDDVGVPAEARALSKDLKMRGWTFVGPTTVYSFMEAMGLVNDHLDGCAIRREVERAQRSWTPPGRPKRRRTRAGSAAV